MSQTVEQLEQAVTEVLETSFDSEECAQVGRGILHVQIQDGPLSLALKDAIDKFAKVLVKNAYIAGFKAGAQSAAQAPTPPQPKRRGFFGAWH